MDAKQQAREARKARLLEQLAEIAVDADHNSRSCRGPESDPTAKPLQNKAWGKRCGVCDATRHPRSRPAKKPLRRSRYRPIIDTPRTSAHPEAERVYNAFGVSSLLAYPPGVAHRGWRPRCLPQALFSNAFGVFCPDKCRIAIRSAVDTDHSSISCYGPRLPGLAGDSRANRRAEKIAQSKVRVADVS